MFIKYLPAFMMLVAGIIALITGMVNNLEVLLSLEILLIVMVIFFILGKIAQKIIVILMIRAKEDALAKAELEKLKELEEMQEGSAKE